MLFNSFVFVLFFVIVYGAYVTAQKSRRIQNALLLVASYVFYGYWDWRFLSLIAISTLIDYFVGMNLAQTDSQTKKRRFLFLSVAANLGILASFKYFNFFASSLADTLSLFGLEAGFVTVNIVLPVGISFYTFQTMSYTLDIYRGKMKPTRDLLDFALYVSFFPQLVAGPIERASRLLPQISAPRKITTDQVNAGIFLLIWGYYKKVVIADNLARIANPVFNGGTSVEGLDLLVGVLAFTFQIYGDFSGYSDIARGLSKLMGFDLMVNFKLPYFASSPSDFWRRWHISLSSWLRDYLYISLGGNRRGVGMTYRNLFLTMLLGGLWHGAAWNFVIWGAYHGGILIMYRLLDKSSHVSETAGETFRTQAVWLLRVSVMFILTIVGWIIFRSGSVTQIVHIITSMGITPQSTDAVQNLLEVAFYVLPLCIVQVIQHRSGNLLVLTDLPAVARILIYGFLLACIVVFGVDGSTEFIYFQF